VAHSGSSRTEAQTPRRRSFMAQPFKHPTSGIYYIRRKVPDELRAALGREYKRSLNTREAGLAKSRFAAAWSVSEQAFALARAQGNGDDVLSQQDAEQIAARWLRAEQEKLERSGRFTGMLAVESAGSWETGGGHDDWERYGTLSEAAAAQGDDGDWPEIVRPYIRRTLAQNSVPLPPESSASYARLEGAFVEVLHKLSEWALKRHEGQREAMGVGVPPHTPTAAERATAPLGKVHRLSELFVAYAEDKKLTDGDNRATKRTINDYGVVVDRFIELFDDLDVRAIDRELVAKYRSALARMPAKGEGIRGMTAPKLIEKAASEGLPLLTAPTIRNRLRAVSAVLSCGVRMGWIRENPIITSGAGRAAAQAASRRRGATKKRQDYTRDELRSIFASPIYTDEGWSPPRADFGRAWYWLPLLMYYTGARREELAQLLTSDIQESEGIWCLSILATVDEDDGERGVKTEGSRRVIPLHPDLIDRGLIAYAKSLPNGQLFPKLKPDPKGYFGANFGKQWANYLRGTVKLMSSASPSHGFRHSFKTLCREVGIPEDVQDAITGHAAAGQGRVARGYGRMPLVAMAREIGRYPRIPVYRSA